MFKLPFYLLLSFSCQLAIAQVRISTLKDTAAYDGSFSFPLIHSPNANIARQINSILQLRILQNTSVQTDQHKAFNNAKYIVSDDSVQAGYTDISYSVPLNNSRVLSLAFEMETMGAYPDSHRDYMSFDLQTGELITAQYLFTAEGCRYLSEYLVSERKKWIKKYLASEKPDAEDADKLQQFYADCNQSPDENNLMIRPGGVLFFKPSCVPHAWAPYDTDLNIALSTKDLKAYLTDAGKRLLQ